MKQYKKPQILCVEMESVTPFAGSMYIGYSNESIDPNAAALKSNRRSAWDEYENGR